MLIDVALKLADTELQNDVYFVFSAQEEVGCRGAKTAAFAIAPDYAIAFDTTTSGDMLGSPPRACELGGGVCIKLMDASAICSRELTDTLTSLAKEAGIPHQRELKQYGGTDTGAMQMAGSGAKAGALTVPIRYTHTCREVVDLRDAKACSALTVEFLKKVK